MKIKLVITFIAMLFLITGCDLFLVKESELIVKNLPEGIASVGVVPKANAQELISTNLMSGWEYLALYTGEPPIILYWYDGVKAGEHFVIITLYQDDYNIKIRRAGFGKFNSDGEATIDWEDMIEYESK